jgi:hypothetical protein
LGFERATRFVGRLEAMPEVSRLAVTAKWNHPRCSRRTSVDQASWPALQSISQAGPGALSPQRGYEGTGVWACGRCVSKGALLSKTELAAGHFRDGPKRAYPGDDDEPRET